MSQQDDNAGDRSVKDPPLPLSPNLSPNDTNIIAQPSQDVKIKIPDNLFAIILEDIPEKKDNNCTKKNIENKDELPFKIVWLNVFLISGLHGLAMGACYSFMKIHYETFIFYALILTANLLGVTAGAHRLWSHRSYKATLPLRIFLMICNTIAMQNSLYEWVRDHRGHHRFSETNADPHNAKRGAFFSHVGWLCLRKHPDVIHRGATLDLSDLEEDGVVMFQKKYYKLLVVLLWGVLPTAIPTIVWHENPVHAFLVCCAFRYCFALHATWLVNSAAHLAGKRPYDRQFWPRENSFVTFLSLGEGYHNFHHVFPWHYSTSEWGGCRAFNVTTLMIDLFCWLKLASDRKTVTEEMITARIERTGDHNLRMPPNCLAHNLIGALVGTCAVWIPILARVIYDFFMYRALTNSNDFNFDFNHFFNNF